METALDKNLIIIIQIFSYFMTESGNASSISRG